MNVDAVLIGSVVCVVGAVVVLGFLGVKINHLMKKDADERTK